ncbi:hypothetical protein [Paenibacillus sp. RC67]|uniref:hypothetical protein n=1 Tax=Paenibacillus sp. RC67 TaxID=3039392 RepID=UPI0024AD703D|nr:hypothetical protein [Paenibacillus sp. RC67]
MKDVRDVFWRLVNNSSWTRSMTIQTSRAQEIGEIIQRKFGRQVEILACRDNGYGKSISTLRLVIFRLEEVELTDLVTETDADAIIDVVPTYGTEERRGRWKRHTNDELADVSKYGNDLSD